MAELIHILHLEDDPMDAELVQSKIAEAELACRITQVQTRAELEDVLRHNAPDIILADYRLPSYDGMSALRLTREMDVDIPFIFVSGTMGEETAIEALTRGANRLCAQTKPVAPGSGRPAGPAGGADPSRAQTGPGGLAAFQ